MSRFTKTNIRIGLVQGFYWAASCVFVSFLVRLLSGYGYSDLECGTALSVSALASLSVQPLLGIVADRMKSVEKLLFSCFLTSVLSTLLILFLNQNRILTYLLVFLVFGAFRSLIYIIDLWSYGVGEKDPSFSYGFTRSFGSIFYAVSALFFGAFIDLWGSRIIIPCFVLISLLCMIMIILAPKSERRVETKHTLPLGTSLHLLLSNRHYLVLLLSYTLVSMTSIPSENYLTRKFEILGAGEIYTGAAFLLMGMLQIPTLGAMDKIGRRWRTDLLLWISLFGILLRTMIAGFASTPLGTVASYLTEPFAFGLYIGAILLYMRKYLDPRVQYFGMTLYAAVTGGFGGIAGGLLAGRLAENYGVMKMMALLNIPAFLGVLLLSLFLLAERKRKDS